MTSPGTFADYLYAKRIVDDRALNRRVWNRLRTELGAMGEDALLHVLELGSGIGSMTERLLEAGVVNHLAYTGVEVDEERARVARERLETWARAHDLTVETEARDRYLFWDGGRQFDIGFSVRDARSVLTDPHFQGSADLLVGHAFFDLFHIPSLVPDILSLLRPGGLFYAAITFDGLTAFEPIIDDDLDADIVRLYHRSMDRETVEGRVASGSRGGRDLVNTLFLLNADLLDVGASDWIVHPRDGGYQPRERDFLGWMLAFVEESLTGHPGLDSGRFADWLQRRRKQVDRAELVFMARNLDVLARVK